MVVTTDDGYVIGEYGNQNKIVITLPYPTTPRRNLTDDELAMVLNMVKLLYEVDMTKVAEEWNKV